MKVILCILKKFRGHNALSGKKSVSAAITNSDCVFIFRDVFMVCSDFLFYGIFSLFIFLSLFFAAGCSFLGHENEFLTGTAEIELALPVWPPEQKNCAYPELDFWLIEYETAEKSGTMRVCAFQKTVTFSVPENKSAAFSARPVTKCSSGSTLFFKGAGCVYPQNTSSFLWNQGFAADILASLYKASNDREKTAELLSVFNWQKFINTLTKKENDALLKIQTASQQQMEKEVYPAYCNPWMLNKQKILSAIADQSFTAASLTFPNAITLSPEDEILQIPGGIKNFVSPYIPENEVFQKFNFLTIIKKTESGSLFLYGSSIALFTVTLNGNPELTVCAIPLY